MPVPTDRNIWIVVPTYCERDNIAPLTEAIRGALPEVRQILIVDDGSPDGTAEVARAIPGVTVLARTGSRGYGHAMRDGLRMAFENGAGAVIAMDADLSHDATILPKLLEGLQRADLVIGSRYCEGSALVENWPWGRLVISQIARTLVQLCTGAAVRDTTSGYRCWSRELLSHMDLDSIQGSGFAFGYECLAQARRSGATFLEVPNVHRGRIHGKSKLTWSITFEALGVLPRMLVRRVMEPVRVLPGGVRTQG